MSNNDEYIDTIFILQALLNARKWCVGVHWIIQRIFELASAYISIFAFCDVISWSIFKCFISLKSLQPKLKGSVMQ